MRSEEGVLGCWKRVSACLVVALRVTAPLTGSRHGSSDAAEASSKCKLAHGLRGYEQSAVTLVLANPLLGHKAARTEHCAERGETENTRGTAISPEPRVVRSKWDCLFRTGRPSSFPSL